MPWRCLALVSALVCLLTPPAVSAVVSGVVLGPDGSPLAGCEVFVEGRDLPEPVTGRSSADGRFALEVPPLSGDRLPVVVARREGLALAWSRLTPGLPLTLKLSGAPVAVRGVVRRSDGAVIAGARVRLVSLHSVWRLHWGVSREGLLPGAQSPWAATTDARGEFSVPGLPSDTVAGLEVSAPGYATVQRSQVCPGGVPTPVFLPRAATVTGIVCSGGRPVPGVRVGPAEGGAVTAPDGRFALQGLAPGACLLEVQPAADGLFAPPQRLLLEEGEQRGGVVLDLQPGAVVSGRCVEAQGGQGVPDLTVTCRGPQGVTSARSAADGSYRLVCPPGEMTLSCTGRLFDPPLLLAANMDQSVRAVAGQVTAAPDFRIEAQPTVKGQVYLPDGTPAAGVEVGALARLESYVAPSDFFEARTDDEGRFALQVLAAGVGGQPPFAIVVRDPGRGLAALQWVDTTRPATITLRPGGYLVTRVQTPAGVPVPGWPVELQLQRFGEFYRRLPGGCSDSTGTLRVGPLPADVNGKLMMGGDLPRLWVNGQDAEGVPFVLAPGEEKPLEPLLLEPQGRTLRGWVGDEDQRPLAGALVVGEQSPYAVYTDQQGRFVLPGLAVRGKVRVVAMHPTRLLFAGALVEPDGSVEPGLVPGAPLSVAARVRQPDGRALPTAEVCEASGSSLSWLSWELHHRLQQCGFDRTWRADPQGAVAASGLVGGLPYRLCFYDRAQRLQQRLEACCGQPGEKVDLGEVVLEAK